MQERFTPKLWTILKAGYPKKVFLSDCLAGVLVGIVALPLAIAFAIASGVSPEKGLYTAVIAGFVIALLGGSRVQVSGPTGAFIVIVYGIVQQYGYEGLALATFMAGFMLIAMGLCGLGALLKFIPYPLTVGFTSGIALIIFSSQIRDLFGLNIDKLPADFIQKWEVLISNFGSINYWSLAVGLFSLIAILLSPKILKSVPGSLVAIVLSTVAVSVFNLPVDTIGSRFGSVPNTLPYPALPEISWELMQKMIAPAFTIAMLGAIESLLSAVVSDGMIGTRHRSDMELIAQGVGNIFSPIFSGIPATGAIARTATNVKSGGRTPVAAIVHAITLLIIMLFFGHLAAKIPLSTLAAVLIIVSYNMSEWRSFIRLLKSPRGDVLILLVTFLLTVLVDLTVAIEVGIVLSALLFIRSMADQVELESITEDGELDRLDLPKGVEAFELHGPLFYGVVDSLRSTLSKISSQHRVLILRMKYVKRVDASGLYVLNDLFKGIKNKGGTVILSELNRQPRITLEHGGVITLLGEGNVCSDLASAVARAKELTNSKS